MGAHEDISEAENNLLIESWGPFRDKSQTPPDILYHYTDADGLQGILESHSIRATHVLYLNDPHEVRHGQWLYEEALKKFGHRATGDKLDFLEKCSSRFEHVKKDEENLPAAYCASLSKERDHLSQYRAYSDGGAGYSIGFSSKALMASLAPYQYATRPLFELIKLEYDLELQEKTMSKLLDNAWKSANDISTKHPADKTIIVERIAIACRDTVMRLSSYFKQEGFKDEAEWRFVPTIWAAPKALPLECYTRTRIRDGIFVPYLELPLGNEHGVFDSVKEIWIGPKLHHKKAYNGLLKSTAFQNVENSGVDIDIKESETALR